MAEEFKKVSLDELRFRFKVRRDPGDIGSLAESISKHGIHEPLIVSEAEDGGYEVIDGLRRCLAAKEAGLREVPIHIVGKNLGFYEFLLIMWEQDKEKKKLTLDEKAAIVSVFVDEFGVRKTARKLRIPKSTVETLAKAGRVFLSVQKTVQPSDGKSQLKIRVNVKLAEVIARRLQSLGYSGERFEDTAARLYLALSGLPTKTALLVLDKWVQNPSLENIDELINECRSLGEVYRFKPAKIDERVPIESGSESSYEELLVGCGYGSRHSYEISSEVSLKLVDFKDGYEAVSGFLCPRCGQPVRCRVCGAIVNCLCGYPHQSVRGRKYRYARSVIHEEG